MLTPKQRSTHLHVLGATGQGKSKFLENLIRQDIEHRHGLCLIDPHGSLYNEIVGWCAQTGMQRRGRKIHLINPNDETWTVGFDPLRYTDPRYLYRTVDSAVDACAQVWGGEDTSKTPTLKRCLRAVFYVLAVNQLPFTDALALTSTNDTTGMRARLTHNLPNQDYQHIWDDLNALTKSQFTETMLSTKNRLFEFVSSPTIRAMLAQKSAALDISQCIEEGHIVLVNLQEDIISSDNARLLGTLLTNVLFRTATRRDKRVAEKRPFYLYIDECYRFLTSDIESMLDQTRGYGLHVTLAHQHLAQLRAYGEHVERAVMTNARTKVVFGGLSEEDAEPLAKGLLRETFDFNRPKHLLDKPVVTGFSTITLRSRSMGRNEARSSGESRTSGDSKTHASQESRTRNYDDWGLPEPGYSGATSSSAGAGTNTSTGTSSSTSSGWSETESEAESLMPILEMLPTAVEGHDEILHRAVLQLRKLPEAYFLLAEPKGMPRVGVTPRIEPLFVSRQRVIAFSSQVSDASPYMRRTETDENDITEEKTEDGDDWYSAPHAH